MSWCGGGDNEFDAWRGVTQFRDVLGDFVSGQLAAFARLGTLCHLDLYLVGAIEILRRHAEPA